MLKSISTFGLIAQRNATNRTLEADLARTNQELSTLKKSDIAGDIGADTSVLIGLRARLGENEAYLQSLDAFDLRAGIMSAALLDVDGAINDLVALTTLNAPQAGDTIPSLRVAAQSAADRIVDVLNVNADGRFLFSGVEINSAPLRRAADINPGTGLSPNDVIAGVLDGTAYAPALPALPALVTAADAADAITRFNGVFDGTNAAAGPPTEDFSFENTFYDGALGGPRAAVRADDGAPTEYGVGADDEAFRQALQGVYMLASVDVQAMAGTDAYEPYVAAALDLLVSGLDGVRLLAADLGAVQAGAADRRAAIETEDTIIGAQVLAYEQADPFETQSRFEAIERQLDAAYAATVRASRLRLTNFL